MRYFLPNFQLGLILLWGLPLFSQEQPNIIFILVDDQRYDFLSFKGHPWMQTPHIDRLAENSMYFDRAYVTTSLCSPSRASILTGQYAHTHRVIDNDTPVPEGTPTFPEELQGQGYQTAFIGKWHMGGNSDMPTTRFKALNDNEKYGREQAAKLEKGLRHQG